MPNSESVITFTCQQHRLAIDASIVARLATGTKKSNYLNREGLSIGLYEVGGAELKVVELFTEQAVGTSSSIVIIHSGDGSQSIALRACQIENLQTESGHKTIPVFDHEISPLFNQAFTAEGAIYFLVNIRALKQLQTEAINASETEDQSGDGSVTALPIRLNSSHWLAYSLSILQAQKRSGQLQIIADSCEAWISFTSGHPTYAAHKVDFGLSALRSIAVQSDWQRYHWHQTENEAAANISETLEAIIRELKTNHTVNQP